MRVIRSQNEKIYIIMYVLEEIILIYILLIRCKLYAAATISLQFMKMKFKCINICFIIIIQLIFWRQCEIHPMSISNSAAFPHTILDSLKQSRLDFSNSKQTFVRIQLLEIDCGRFLFSDISCAKQE